MEKTVMQIVIRNSARQYTHSQIKAVISIHQSKNQSINQSINQLIDPQNVSPGRWTPQVASANPATVGEWVLGRSVRQTVLANPVMRTVRGIRRSASSNQRQVHWKGLELILTSPRDRSFPINAERWNGVKQIWKWIGFHVVTGVSDCPSVRPSLMLLFLVSWGAKIRSFSHMRHLTG